MSLQLNRAMGAEGGWEMSAAAKASIAKIAATLAPHQTTKINVMQYMISQGVNPQLVSAQGFGESHPVASNDTPTGRAQNRRVELTVARVAPQGTANPSSTVLPAHERVNS